MRIDGEVLFSLTLAAALVVFAAMALDFPGQSGIMPLLAAAGGAVFVSWDTVARLLRRAPDESAKESTFRGKARLFGWFVAAVVAVVVFGFAIGAAVSIFAFLVVEEKIRPVRAGIAAAVSWGAFVAGFEHLLGVLLFEGLLWPLLG